MVQQGYQQYNIEFRGRIDDRHKNGRIDGYIDKNRISRSLSAEENEAGISRIIIVPYRPVRDGETVSVGQHPAADRKGELNSSGHSERGLDNLVHTY